VICAMRSMAALLGKHDRVATGSRRLAAGR